MASVGGFVNASLYRTHQMKNRSKSKVYCVSSSTSATDPYQTLRIPRGASESDVKKAFRKLALKYHPDVCRGNDCGVQFHRIYQAYDVLMDKLKEEAEVEKVESYYDPEEMWDEWMGYEGAGIRDYTNPYN